MTEYIIYSMNELITNAKKANTKRIYFKEKDLDINDQDDYDLGMKTFKNDTMSNIKYYLNKQKEDGYFVKLVLQAKEDTIIIEIHVSPVAEVSLGSPYEGKTCCTTTS